MLFCNINKCHVDLQSRKRIASCTLERVNRCNREGLVVSFIQFEQNGFRGGKCICSRLNQSIFSQEAKLKLYKIKNMLFGTKIFLYYEFV
jgi:hypothetical protein